MAVLVLDPPGMRRLYNSEGFQAIPSIGFIPQLPRANPAGCDLPSKTVPRATKTEISVSLMAAGFAATANDPAFVDYTAAVRAV
jgi:hypothetical protein